MICSSLNRDRFIIVSVVTEDSTRKWRKFRGAGHFQKQTYLFVPPAFVEEYSGGFDQAFFNSHFLEYVQELREGLFPKIIIDKVQTPSNEAAGMVLVSGHEYVLAGKFLGEHHKDEKKPKTSVNITRALFVSESDSQSVKLTVLKSTATHVHILVEGTDSSPSRIGLIQYINGQQLYAVTSELYVVAKS